MITVDRVAALRQQITAWKRDGDTIAFIPTMGNLHDGHLSLFDAARAHHGSDKALRLVASVYVNPLQFGPNEDFDTYPRSLQQDLDRLHAAAVGLVFTPTNEEMYPHGQQHETRVVPAGIGDILEGEHRPGFFSGVATVVNKLFNMVQPDIAVFGQKDFQQLLVVRRMVQDFAMPIEIVAAATVREDDGLAMSSRNQYLDDNERTTAAELGRCIDHLVGEVQAGTDSQYAVMHVTRELEQAGFLVDYIVVRRRADLGVPTPQDTELVALAAARLGGTRLIDNKSFDLSVS